MRQDRVIERKITLKNLGYYHYRIGTSLLMVGELVRSLEEYRQAYNVHAELLAGARDDPELIRTAALDALTLGNGSYLLGRREAAEEYFRQSLDLIEQFDRARKGASDARFLFASYRSVVGLYRFRIGQREAARREYQSARDLLVALKTADPQNIYYRSELVVLLGRLGRLEEIAQQPGAARSAFEEAYRLAEENYRVDEKNDLRRMALVKLLPGSARSNGPSRWPSESPPGPKSTRNSGSNWPAATLNAPDPCRRKRPKERGPARSRPLTLSARRFAAASAIRSHSRSSPTSTRSARAMTSRRCSAKCLRPPEPGGNAAVVTRRSVIGNSGKIVNHGTPRPHGKRQSERGLQSSLRV